MQILANNEIFVYARNLFAAFTAFTIQSNSNKNNANKYFYMKFLFLKSINKIII